MSDNPQFPELQSAVATYLTTPKGQLSVALYEVFARDGVVHDDGHTLSAIVQPSAAIVGVLVKGEFPGSPVELHHHFSLTANRISALTICT